MVRRKGLVCIFFRKWNENLGTARSSLRRWCSFLTLHKTNVEESQHPFQGVSFFYGLSHGLKIARPLSILAPVYALVPLFRVPLTAKNKREQKLSLIFGTPEGTRTPDLLVRSQSLYPTELPAQNGADDEARTRYLHLGKVALYQMSYIRKCKKYYTYKTVSCQ